MTGNCVTGKDVVLRYDGDVALDRSSFEIPAGAITSLIGPNGSGKSTLLNAIAGLHDPNEGVISTATDDGHTVRVSYVLQTTKVNDALPITVREVVAMGRYAAAGAHQRLRKDDHAAIAEAMERMHITDLANKHLRDLSGGQRQRVFVAQGLAQDHDLLLLDEPLTGLDLTSARAIDEVIHDEPARGCSVIMTTHDLAEAQVSDYVILLSGRVVAAGKPADALTLDNLTAAYGAHLLHVEEGRPFIDDPAHLPAGARHLHRDRTIHVEPSTTDLHGGEP